MDNQFNHGIPAGSSMSSGNGMMMVGVAGMAAEFGYGHMSGSWLNKNLISKKVGINRELNNAKRHKTTWEKAVNSGIKDADKYKDASKASSKLAIDRLQEMGLSKGDLDFIVRKRKEFVENALDNNKYKGLGYHLRDKIVGRGRHDVDGSIYNQFTDKNGVKRTGSNHGMPAKNVKTSTRGGLFGWMDNSETARMKGIIRRANHQTMLQLAKTPSNLQSMARTYVAAKSFARVANYAGLADLGFSIGAGIYGGISDLGATLRHGGGKPGDFSDGFSDTQVAHTMRQRSMQAIQRSQLGARRSLGSEASILHAAR